MGQVGQIALYLFLGLFLSLFLSLLVLDAVGRKTTSEKQAELSGRQAGDAVRRAAASWRGRGTGPQVSGHEGDASGQGRPQRRSGAKDE